MNREEAAKKWPIMKAYAEGEEVQYKNQDGEWTDMKEPSFIEYAEYRIKLPQPVIKFVVIEYDKVHHRLYNSYEEAIQLYPDAVISEIKLSFDPQETPQSQSQSIKRYINLYRNGPGTWLHHDKELAEEDGKLCKEYIRTLEVVI